jgi:hypothetical protein
LKSLPLALQISLPLVLLSSFFEHFAPAFAAADALPGSSGPATKPVANTAMEAVANAIRFNMKICFLSRQVNLNLRLPTY